jgi:hypothetical protein
LNAIDLLVVGGADFLVAGGGADFKELFREVIEE